MRVDLWLCTEVFFLSICVKGFLYRIFGDPVLWVLCYCWGILCPRNWAEKNVCPSKSFMCFTTFLEWKFFLGTLCSSNMQICSIDSIEEQSRFLQFRIPFAALFDFSYMMNWLNCFRLHSKRNITLSCTALFETTHCRLNSCSDFIDELWICCTLWIRLHVEFIVQPKP